MKSAVDPKRLEHGLARSVEPSRRELVVGVASSVLLGACTASWRRQAEQALLRGARALESLQGADGAYRSGVYGMLREGWSLTPYAVLSLVRSGVPFNEERAAAGMSYVTKGARDGLVGVGGSIPDYPCYATAMTLEVLVRTRPSGWQGAAVSLGRALRSLQLRRGDGWDGHPGQGGFRMGARDAPAPPNAGHVDLSMTRVAVEALRAAGAESHDLAVAEAVDFARRCRTETGSFVYSAADPSLNKGPTTGDPGYGTATADGLLLLTAASRTQELDRSVQQLHRMHRLDQNPGVAQGRMPMFATAMRYYYRRVSARAFRQRGGPDGWARAMAATLVAEQGADGLWRNPEGAQKEDDPIVSTGSAIVCLGAVLQK